MCVCVCVCVKVCWVKIWGILSVPPGMCLIGTSADVRPKKSDGKVPVMLEHWEILSILALPSLPGPLWPRVSGST